MKKLYIQIILLCFVILSPFLSFILIKSLNNVLSSTSAITQIISPGILVTDFVDDTYQSVVNPTVAMNNQDFAFTCHDSTGTLGTSSQKIYVLNPDSADNGWSLTIAPSNTTDLWSGTSGSYDFNDPTSSGCADGADADSYAGQMSLNASSGTLTVGGCSSCNTTGISKGSLASFSEGVLNSVTLLTADLSSSDVGDWVLTGVPIAQTIPGEQPAGNDYSINLTLTVTAL